MSVNKAHLEFHPVDMAEGWAVPEGYPPGVNVQEKILAGALDEAAREGTRTRLLRFGPGVRTTRPFVHEYWEEVYLVSGDLWVGAPDGSDRWERFTDNTYACRPPGVFHGPFRSDAGCLLLEVHYYEESAAA